MTVKYYGHIIRKKLTIPCHTGTLYTPNNTHIKKTKHIMIMIYLRLKKKRFTCIYNIYDKNILNSQPDNDNTLNVLTNLFMFLRDHSLTHGTTKYHNINEQLYNTAILTNVYKKIYLNINN